MRIKWLRTFGLLAKNARGWGLARVAGGVALFLAVMSAPTAARAQAVNTTTVQGTVYLANGQPGAGTLVVSWPAFTTAGGQAIVADSATVTIPPDGFLSVNLAPNVGATPAGEYYTAVFYMSDGSTSTQYWVVPAAAQSTLAEVESQVMPAVQAVQTVSKAYVDQSISEINQSLLAASGGSLSGPLYLNADPTQSLQAADKHYVDTQVATALPLSGGTLSGSLSATQIGAVYQADQFPGTDFGSKLQACLNALNANYGGTCDARNFAGSQTMGSNLMITTASAAVLLPCTTISTANQIIVAAGTRNVALHGCAMRGGSAASGSQGGTAFAYTGSGAMVRVGDPTYAADTLGFHIDNVVINTTGATSSTAQAFSAYRTQELDLEGLYFLGNSNQTAMTLDGTGNYTGGTFLDDQLSGFGTAVNAIGHQAVNPATTDWMNASAFVRLHVDCPTNNGNPINGTYGINLQQGDGNTFTGGDVEGCSTALHLGTNAQNNTVVGLRTENSTNQVVADAGSAYNDWITGGTMFTGKLTDSGTRNSFLDTFHRSFNGLSGDWYGSQQDATVTNHYRLGIGGGNERGLLDRYQTDYGYRWTAGLSDATAGEQFYQVLDELNNVYRLSIGQYNNGQSSTNNQTALNAAGTGAVVLNGSNNSGTGGVIFGSGGPTETTVATINNGGNAQFNGTLQVGGTAQAAGTMTVRNNADAEVDYYLWPGLTTSQKGSFTYKDWNGNSQWYMLKDASNNWALNSAQGGLDSFKAYQSSNSGDTYINSSNSSGHIRLNYEAGSGSETDIYSGSSTNLDAAFLGPTSIKFPGLAASTGHSCLQVDSSGYLTNTGTACGTGSGSGGTISSGNSGQIAYYTANGTTVGGMNAVPLASGGTGATTASGALASLGALSAAATTPQTFAGSLTGPSIVASVNSQINVMAPPYNAKGDCSTDDQAAINAALRAADTYAIGLSKPAVVYFPKPPGGCYLTSTLMWDGESLEGQAPGNGGSSSGNAGVIIRGKPGEDILNPTDPSTNNVTFYNGWNISHLTFIVDDTAAPSFPHRWPGKWVDDGAMTAGSAQFTSQRSDISCGDIGQAIQVTGAGPSGQNLVTTITSVTPCWASTNPSAWPEIITLATAASTTVSNAHTYISVGDLPVTANIGNCALAFDNKDGNTADWPSISGFRGNSYSSLSDVQITTVSLASNGQNSSCGIYSQGNWQMYGIDARNLGIDQLVYGIVQGTSEINPYNGNAAGDYEKWDHLLFNLTNYPWISYDGGENELENWELTTGFGPQILAAQMMNEQAAGNWDIQIPEFEYNSGSTGWRITGSNFTVRNTVFSEGGNQKVYLDTRSLNCINCGFGNGPVYINGEFNKIQLGSSGAWGATNIFDGGRNNKIIAGEVAGGEIDGMPLSQDYSLFPMKGTGISGQQTSDFIQSGNVNTPWTNNNDLFFWPQDIFVNGAGLSPMWNYNGGAVIADATSPSGEDFVFSNGAAAGNFTQFAKINSQGYGVIGTSIPATNVIIYFAAKCPTGSSFPFQVLTQSSSGNTTVASANFSCTSSFATYSVTANLAPYVGQWIVFYRCCGGDTADVAYWAIRPYQHDYNGQQPVLSAAAISTTGTGASVPTGPTSSTSGDVTQFTGTNGQIADSGIALSSLTAKAAAGACTSGQYETGDTSGGPSCAQVQYNQLSGAAPTWNQNTTGNAATATNFATQVSGVVEGNGVSAPSAATSHNLSALANCVTTGSANIYSCTTSPTFNPAAGDHIQIEFNVANTGSSTVAVNGASAATIRKWGNTANLASGDIQANHWISATFDGTYWQLEGQLGNANATQVNGNPLPMSAPALATNSSGQLVSASVPSITSATSTTSTSLASTGMALPTVPASTTVHGTCAIIWEGSSTSYSTTFGIGANYAPTDLWVLGTMHSGANGGTLADKYTTITSTTVTAVTTAGTPGTATTGYRADIDFTLVTGANPVTLTLYYESSNSSGTSSIEPGSACWLM